MKSHSDRAKLDKLFPYIRQYQQLAEEHGINDIFQIFTARLYDVDVISYDIYDRWGEHVWSDEAFTINTGKRWWDGMFLGQKSMIDVYAYVIRVRYQDGSEGFFKGDVTLLR